MAINSATVTVSVNFASVALDAPMLRGANRRGPLIQPAGTHTNPASFSGDHA
jgi:hypothetical protein